MNFRSWANSSPRHALQRCLAIALIISASPVLAQDEVFGLSLREPLNIPICERSPFPKHPRAGVCSGHPDAVKPETSFSEDAAIFFANGDLPQWVNTDLHMLTPVSAHFEKGNLIGVSIKTRGVQVENIILDVLTKKYGRHTSSRESGVQNRMGAQYSARTYTWKFPDLNVVYNTIAGSLNSGSLFIGTDSALLAIQKRQEDDLRKTKEGSRPL